MARSSRADYFVRVSLSPTRQSCTRTVSHRSCYRNPSEQPLRCGPFYMRPKHKGQTSRRPALWSAAAQLPLFGPSPGTISARGKTKRSPLTSSGRTSRLPYIVLPLIGTNEVVLTSGDCWERRGTAEIRGEGSRIEEKRKSQQGCRRCKERKGGSGKLTFNR